MTKSNDYIWYGIVVSVQDDLQKKENKDKYDHEVCFGVIRPRFVFSSSTKIKKGTKITLKASDGNKLSRKIKKFTLTIFPNNIKIGREIDLVCSSRIYLYSKF